MGIVSFRAAGPVAAPIALHTCTVPGWAPAAWLLPLLARPRSDGFEEQEEMEAHCEGVIHIIRPLIPFDYVFIG